MLCKAPNPGLLSRTLRTMRTSPIQTLVGLLTISVLACSGMTGVDTADAGTVCENPLPYASEVVAFTAGSNAGHGAEQFPDVVLGPPTVGPPSVGSLDVLSLGVGGEIIVGFGDRMIEDGPGADFIVWENAFWISGNPENTFAELGEVAVSSDGETWTSFPCDPERTDGFDPGCAGWRPRQEFEPCAMVSLLVDQVGGDPFDLADIGVSSARYVRIRDRGVEGAPMKDAPPLAGFDLDAVGVVHWAPVL
jgi:hypothetical protein